ncbi:MAG: tRNA pseudouridine(55) synthase TruB [Chloroflexi bacterium]|nr:tRNA pseudouridine(55) synthase TruB [Chloroflexota bacterium]
MRDFGLILVDKPVGPTSHRVVHRVRQGAGIRKVGHAGTLDPRASGLLVLCLGAATRLSEYISASSKCYEAVVRFGATTRTYDGDGEVVRRSVELPSREEVEAALQAYTGEIQQVPPPFSAVKVAGRRAYDLARSGKEVELGPRSVTIYALRVCDFQPPDLALEIECSAGTYIRSLAHDLGERLGCGGYLDALRRTKAGPFSLSQAVTLDRLENAFLDGTWVSFVHPPIEALPEFARLQLDAEQADRIRLGNSVAAAPGSQGLACALDPQGELIAILEATNEGQEWHPRKVFLE